MVKFTHEEVDQIESELRSAVDGIYSAGSKLVGSPEAVEIRRKLSDAWESAKAALHSLYVLRPLD